MHGSQTKGLLSGGTLPCHPTGQWCQTNFFDDKDRTCFCFLVQECDIAGLPPQFERLDPTAKLLHGVEIAVNKKPPHKIVIEKMVMGTIALLEHDVFSLQQTSGQNGIKVRLYIRWWFRWERGLHGQADRKEENHGDKSPREPRDGPRGVTSMPHVETKRVGGGKPPLLHLSIPVLGAAHMVLERRYDHVNI